MSNVKYRIYADGEIVHEDDFSERDNAQPFYDDYVELECTGDEFTIMVGEE